MTKVGIVGLGFMGWIHWLAYQKVDGIQVVAICETDPKKRAGDWTSIQGNFGPPGEQVDLSGIQVFENLDQMLSSSELDLVDICLPPSAHCQATVKALDSGRHVFCEKPMSLKIEECDQMLAAADRNSRQLMVGHVLPFFPEYSIARQYASDKTFGELLGGTFKRVISDPTWLTHFYDPDVIGGPLLDLHVHDAHLIRMLFGMPTQVDTSARFQNGLVKYCNSLFRFENPEIVVSAVSGVIDQQGRPFNHAFELHFEQATMQFEFAAFSDQPESLPLKIMKADGEVMVPSVQADSDIAGFVSEIREVQSALSENRPSPILSGNLASDAIRLCHLQSKSADSRAPIAVD